MSPSDRWVARPGGRPTGPLVAAAPVAIVLLAAGGRSAGAPEAAVVAVVDAVLLLVSACAAVLCAARALRPTPRRDGSAGPSSPRSAPGPAPWWFFAAGTASWAAGQAVWTFEEVVLGLDPSTSPVPSTLYFGCALLAPVGMVLLAHEVHPATSAVRSALDGLLAGGALFVLSWLALLEPSAAGERPPLLLLDALAPVGDVVLLTAALTLAARCRLTAVTGPITAGALLLVVADIGYVVLSGTSGFTTGGLLDAAWTAAFVLVASAARAPAAPRGAAGADDLTRTGGPLTYLPYLPLALALPAVVVEGVHRRLTGFELGTAAVLTALLVVRQALVVRENTRLTRELAIRSAALADLAFTDALTGLPNRAAFTGALQQALHDGPVVVAFCDLDGFKGVNDACGHAEGDALLVEVARLLERVVGGAGVVARLGGDEFAVVVPGGGGPVVADELRERLVGVLPGPGGAHDPRHGAVVAVRLSAGAVASGELGSAPCVEDLLREADRRMYAAKRARRVARRP